MMKNKFLLLFIISLLSFCPLVDWYIYDSENYKISFPQEPIEENKTMQTLGGEVQVQTLTYKAKDNMEKNLRFYFSVNEIPNVSEGKLTTEEQKTFFDVAINGSVRNHKAILISDHIISLDSYSGREVKMSVNDDKIIANMRIYIVGNKYYGLLAYSTKANDGNSEMAKFFKSFEVKNNSK